MVARTLRTRKCRKWCRRTFDHVLETINKGIDTAVDGCNVETNVKQKFRCTYNSSRRFYHQDGSRQKRVGNRYRPYLLMAALQLHSTPMFVNAQFRVPQQVDCSTQYVDLSSFDRRSVDSDSNGQGGIYEDEDQAEPQLICHHVLEEYESEDELVCFANKYSRGNKNHFGVPKYTFDTDSFQIGIDTFASACMSPEISNFIPNSLTPMKTRRTVTSFGKDGPKLQVHMKGTLRWTIEDNDGRKHEFKIKDSLYVPDGNMRLLSPQHWAIASNTLSSSTPCNKHKKCSL